MTDDVNLDLTHQKCVLSFLRKLNAPLETLVIKLITDQRSFIILRSTEQNFARLFIKTGFVNTMNIAPSLTLNKNWRLTFWRTLRRILTSICSISKQSGALILRTTTSSPQNELTVFMLIIGKIFDENPNFSTTTLSTNARIGNKMSS